MIKMHMIKMVIIFFVQTYMGELNCCKMNDIFDVELLIMKMYRLKISNVVVYKYSKRFDVFACKLTLFYDVRF